MNAVWMVFAALSFSVMAGLVKALGGHYSAPEVLFYRCLTSVFIVMAIAALFRVDIVSKNWLMHLRRAFLATISMGVWYFLISRLPLSIAVTLNYSSPIFVALFFLVSNLKSKSGSVSWLMYLAIAVGFVGVLMLAKPSGDVNEPWLIGLGVAGAFCAALAFQDIKRLSSAGETEWVMVFYFSLYATLFSAALLPFTGFTLPGGVDLVLFFCIALFATLGQFFVSRAYSRGHPLVAASLQYLGVVFSAIFGFVFWHESLSLSGYLGIFAIVASGLASTFVLKQSRGVRA